MAAFSLPATSIRGSHRVGSTTPARRIRSAEVIDLMEENRPDLPHAPINQRASRPLAQGCRDRPQRVRAKRKSERTRRQPDWNPPTARPQVVFYYLLRPDQAYSISRLLPSD